MDHTKIKVYLIILFSEKMDFVILATPPIRNAILYVIGRRPSISSTLKTGQIWYGVVRDTPKKKSN